MAANTLHIANFFECDRLSAVAGEAMSVGMVVKVSDNGLGERLLMKLGDADAASLANGKYAVVTKEAIDPFEVTDSTAGPDTGNRLVSIASGDAVLELRMGAKLEYSCDLLHASLNPGATPTPGVLPQVGDALTIKGSQWAAGTGVSGSISPAPGRVLRVFGAGASAQVVIELVAV